MFYTQDIDEHPALPGDSHVLGRRGDYCHADAYDLETPDARPASAGYYGIVRAWYGDALSVFYELDTDQIFW